MTREQIIDDALSLPISDLTEVVNVLSEALETHSPATSPELMAEIRRRRDAIQNGTATLISHDEVMASARALLK
jgi:hypothetical protein